MSSASINQPPLEPLTNQNSSAPLQQQSNTETELEVPLDTDIDMSNPSTNQNMNLDGAGDDPTQTEPHPTAPSDPRVPTKKDASLREFLSKMDDYAPIIPDAVTTYYLTLGGLPPPPQTSPHLARLLALATQKFIADVAADAYQYARIRASNTSSANNPLGGLATAAGVPGGVGVPSGGGQTGGSQDKKGAAALGIQRAGYGGGGQGGGQGRTVLTMEDLGMAVGEYGVNIKRGEFYR
ncbi:MAG: hypothetical protein M1834_007601 [Cirrosporium novae-zelandiae]|nr:MAG: hypothetical protein M1834_007601 [Cirrosporium novae-zelandiae]